MLPRHARPQQFFQTQKGIPRAFKRATRLMTKALHAWLQSGLDMLMKWQGIFGCASAEKGAVPVSVYPSFR